MTSPLARALGATDGARQVLMVPVTVTQVSPLLIVVNGGAPIAGLKIAGADYTLGAALALVQEGGTPLVIPIGA
jgi:hypothetical protein